MSIVRVVKHTENIYNILYKPPPDREKSPRYESKLPPPVVSSLRPLPRPRATMGPPDLTQLPHPQDFLRRGTGGAGARRKEERDKEARCLLSTRLPSVPARASSCPARKQHVKNHRLENKRRACVMRPGQPTRKLVDSKGGASWEVDTPLLLRGRGRGRQGRRIWGKGQGVEGQENQETQETKEEKALCRLVSEEERQELLKGLRENWSSLQRQFLLLPMQTDTIPKVLKKKSMEEKLSQLEKDIRAVEENQYIYVYQ